MKNSHPARILVAGIVVLALLCTPALALTKDEILSQYRSSSGSTSIRTLIDEIVAPASHDQADDGSWFTTTNEYPDCPPGEVCIGERIDLIEDEPSGSEGRYICPPDKPIGKLHHSWCMCMSYRNVETGEVGNSECTNPETGQPYPMGTDDAGRTFIVKEDCPCAWADEYGIPDPPVRYDILISRKPTYSDESSLLTSKIQDILDTDIRSVNSNNGDLTFFPMGRPYDSTIWC